MACPKCGCKVTYQFDNSDEDLSAPDERLERCAACGEIFDIDDHTPEDDDYDSPPIQSARPTHAKVRVRTPTPKRQASDRI